MVFASPSVFAADLVQIYRAALMNDAVYAAARATAEAGREKEPQGLAGLLPVIGATGNTTWNDNQYAVDGSPKLRREYKSNAYTVTLTQPLFRWQNVVQYGQTKLLVVQSEAIFAQAVQDLIVRVAQAYFDVLNAQENLKAVQPSPSNWRRRRRTLRSARRPSTVRRKPSRALIWPPRRKSPR